MTTYTLVVIWKSLGQEQYSLGTLEKAQTKIDEWLSRHVGEINEWWILEETEPKRVAYGKPT